MSSSYMARSITHSPNTDERAASRDSGVARRGNKFRTSGHDAGSLAAL